ncbi:hypothetical protein EG856_00580 [Mycoplasmopsis phocirhinis]|uniref:Uncharacterized protein n=1 Tax=Mycoplasmopsis phocirhinis TaxID=142650 RepID=A0A4P6MLT6_9BACT|nr:hypothetical protein [Mycoplasmopsis phocirhinis]QBF34428.1 hypothetical protein EG856_00580 [Mycoplasmopsis phocirhinis]
MNKYFKEYLAELENLYNTASHQFTPEISKKIREKIGRCKKINDLFSKSNKWYKFLIENKEKHFKEFGNDQDFAHLLSLIHDEIKNYDHTDFLLILKTEVNFLT